MLIQNIFKPKAQEIKPVKQEKLKRLGSIKIYKGHTLWEINVKTGEINEAEFNEDSKAVFGKKGKTAKKLIIKKGMYYESALNRKNALRKFKEKFGIK